jgi:hypothetical protein
MRVIIDPGVLTELQYIVDLHRRYGADNPVYSVEGLVGHVLAAVANGSERPDASERLLLEVMGLVAYCSEHAQDRGCRDPAEPEGGGPTSEARSKHLVSACWTDCADTATVITEAVELLSRAVAALHGVLAVFDTSEYRNPERRARESAALRAVYAVLGKPWPVDAESAVTSSGSVAITSAPQP